jgi:ABC-type bacteriocin/lantibiotic exporter with double-glycine peptidase domain
MNIKKRGEKLGKEVEEIIDKITPPKIPYYKQETNYTCGAACMRMVLESMKIKKSEKQIANLLKTNKVVGTWHKNIPELAEKYKLNYLILRDATWLDLVFYHQTGWRVIVCLTREKVPHYAVVKKINWHSIYFLDPYYGPKERMFIHRFKKKWHDHEGKKWLVAIKPNEETKKKIK